MTIVAPTSPVTDGVLAALRTIGPLIGDAEKPAHHDNEPASMFPYAIVYVGTPRLDGSLVDPKEDGLHRVQVTCVGRLRDSAEVLRDACRAILCDTTAVDLEDHAVVWTELAGDPPTFREDALGSKPALYTAITVVNLFVTPLTSGS